MGRIEPKWRKRRADPPTTKMYRINIRNEARRCSNNKEKHKRKTIKEREQKRSSNIRKENEETQLQHGFYGIEENKKGTRRTKGMLTISCTRHTSTIKDENKYQRKVKEYKSNRKTEKKMHDKQE